MRITKLAISAIIALPVMASAAEPAYPDTILIPERVVSIGGNPSNAADLVAILYNRENLHHSDPSAPRFLFVDREGKVALGIGGYVKGTLQYDFAGSINEGADFITYSIPVPSDPAQRSQFFANANQSTFFIQMLGRTQRFGTYEMFIQTNFSGGGNNGYDLKLKQAYLRLGYVRAGLTNSTFVDGGAGTPTIDDQGPAGEVGKKNILLQYLPRLSSSVTAGVGIEMPSATYRTGTHAEAINQRCPDIPAYIQYGWDGGNSHFRLSGILRNLSYRDLTAQKNRFATGWAVQLSGFVSAANLLRFYYQGAVGHGYGTYVNDLSCAGADLIPDPDHEGKLHAPLMSNYELGLQYNITPNAFLAAAYSEAHLGQARSLGGDTYKYGQYATISGYYTIVRDFTVGVEYLFGRRTNYDGSHGSANRIEGMLKLIF